MRLSITLALLLALFGACEPPLPEGAYPEREAGANPGMPSAALDAGRSDSGGASAPPIGGGSGGSTSGTSDAGVGGGMGGEPGTGGTQGGGGGTMGGVVDSGVPLTAAQQRLAKLEGRYYMRMDMLSSATAQASIIKIRTKNLVSHLYVVQLQREGDSLNSRERLCHQTYQIQCVDNSCISATTTMSAAVVDMLVNTGSLRALTVNGMQLAGESQTMAIGFDSDKNPALPTSLTDSRVWDPVKGNSVREGLLLNADLRTTLKSVNCDVYNVMKFVSSFSGKLGGTTDAPSLLNQSFALTSDANESKTLGSNNSDCGGQSSSNTSKGAETLRFAAVPADLADTAFWNCPDIAEWDKRLSPPNVSSAPTPP